MTSLSGVVCVSALLLVAPLSATAGDGDTAGAQASAWAGPAGRPTGSRLEADPADPAGDDPDGDQTAQWVPAAPAVTGLPQAAVRAAEAVAVSTTHLAIAVLDRDTGELATGTNGTEALYTASLSKLVVAVDVLERHRLEGLTVTDADLALFRRALGPSDDSAMNVLWNRFDGAHAAGRLTDRLELTGTADPADPSQWGEMLVSAADHVRLWEYVLDEMDPTDSEFLLSALGAAPARAADGFAQDFGLLAPAVDGAGGPGAVAKQGWMCCLSRQYYLHSVGMLGAGAHHLVVLLSRQPRGVSWPAARAELTRIATEVVRVLD
ncbi:hypothetical protein [Pseudonocardia acidicola]|uniref:Beta-lactamase family protein n=1 Tax=Pseudonocardia acidicola TaxID=2724939 RepID=A0ABX1SLV4_9PSEU|nr:hypothetical protein [Pseudonocardia acidicola]NMI01255.1 hypothetical protein [Pseudonocardia acidicola]